MSKIKKDMEKYRDIDEDELLKKLSEEELQRLEDELEELDPDVSSRPRDPRGRVSVSLVLQLRVDGSDRISETANIKLHNVTIGPYRLYII